MAAALMFWRNVKCENFTGLRESTFAAFAATGNPYDLVLSADRNQNHIRAADLLRPIMLLHGLRHADQHPVRQKAGVSRAP